MDPLPPGLNKIEAVALLAEQAGLAGVDPYAADQVAAVLAGMAPRANQRLRPMPAAEAPGAKVARFMPARDRTLPKPRHTNGRPGCFPEQAVVEHSPPFEVLELPRGFLAMIGRAPVAITAGEDALVTDFSSPYACLARLYDTDMGQILRDARRMEGLAVVLCDDVHPLNYAHWLLDELPRLAFLGERRAVSIVVSGSTPRWQAESLLLCGFDPRRLVCLEDFTAVRADCLLVPRDLHAMPHPAHKAAPWVLDFLRGRLGLAALAQQGAAAPSKLYISRADAEGRRVVDEPAMMALLAPLGYRMVTLGGLRVAEQAALFARASHVVGLHGAGLANFAFAPAGAQLVEIFPASYGTPAYYVLAAGQGNPYASYVGRAVPSAKRSQLDDVSIDIADFAACCAGLL